MERINKVIRVSRKENSVNFLKFKCVFWAVEFVSGMIKISRLGVALVNWSTIVPFFISDGFW